MKNMRDQPGKFLQTQPGGASLKPLPQVLLERRATPHFRSEQIPDEYLRQIIELGTQAPSGYNLQPWRLILVRDQENKKRLQKAAFDQEKVSEASVVIIFVGMKEETKKMAEEILRDGARRGAGRVENVPSVKESALQFLSQMPMDLWTNRHTMIAFTTTMLLAEAYGFDTAPMEGFDPAAVKREFNIPEDGEVAALLAIGRVQEPDRAYPGRLELEKIVFSEKFGNPWE
jgi:nitroreductase